MTGRLEEFREFLEERLGEVRDVAIALAFRRKCHDGHHGTHRHRVDRCREDAVILGRQARGQIGLEELRGQRHAKELDAVLGLEVGGAALATRLAEIADELAVVLAELKPHAVAVEGVFHGRNARSALQLGQARGAALTAAGRAGLSVFEYAPATVKRAVTGSGAATKTQVAAMVRTLCKLSRAPRLDASDALAIAICHALRARRQLIP